MTVDNSNISGITAIGIVKMLADWSVKYPRGRVYPMSQKKMDDELIQIEEIAKQFIAKYSTQNNENS